jgi:hypothetical protein
LAHSPKGSYEPHHSSLSIIWIFERYFVNQKSFGVVNTFVGFVSNEACASGKKKTCCVLRPGPTKTMTEIVSLLNYSERTAKMPNIYIYICLFGCRLRTPCRKRASSFDGFHLATLIQKGIYILLVCFKG